MNTKLIQFTFYIIFRCETTRAIISNCENVLSKSRQMTELQHEILHMSYKRLKECNSTMLKNEPFNLVLVNGKYLLEPQGIEFSWNRDISEELICHTEFDERREMVFKLNSDIPLCSSNSLKRIHNIRSKVFGVNFFQRFTENIDKVILDLTHERENSSFYSYKFHFPPLAYPHLRSISSIFSTDVDSFMVGKFYRIKVLESDEKSFVLFHGCMGVYDKQYGNTVPGLLNELETISKLNPVTAPQSYSAVYSIPKDKDICHHQICSTNTDYVTVLLMAANRTAILELVEGNVTDYLWYWILFFVFVLIVLFITCYASW